LVGRNATEEGYFGIFAAWTRSPNKAAGALDKLAGRVLEAFSKLTGNRSAGAKGKAARGRGAGRSAMGRFKSETK
jgi:uncharacterized protein YjbJ (UPF0337 family)